MNVVQHNSHRHRTDRTKITRTITTGATINSRCIQNNLKDLATVSLKPFVYPHIKPTSVNVQSTVIKTVSLWLYTLFGSIPIRPLPRLFIGRSHIGWPHRKLCHHLAQRQSSVYSSCCIHHCVSRSLCRNRPVYLRCHTVVCLQLPLRREDDRHRAIDLAGLCWGGPW